MFKCSNVQVAYSSLELLGAFSSLSLRSPLVNLCVTRIIIIPKHSDLSQYSHGGGNIYFEFDMHKLQLIMILTLKINVGEI